MVTRYTKRNIFKNDDELYGNILRKRGLKHINHYDTPILRHPNEEEIQELALATHIWKTGDSFWKLAHEHYDNPDYWWIIPWFNKKPTEFHFKLGDNVFIPLPLEDVLITLGL